MTTTHDHPVGEGPRIVDCEPQPAVVLRRTVPMTELTAFFSEAFARTSEAAAGQGVAVTGPPFGLYRGQPGETVDVSAGFPTAAMIAAAGEVAPALLPGGEVAQMLHRGSYDSLGTSYGRLTEWMQTEGLVPAGEMWESYLNEPDPSDPEGTLTLISWPVKR